MVSKKQNAQQQILTPEQDKFLELISRNKYVRERFYFTGGTPLSAFYLQHRLSEDIDFFSEKEIYLPSVRGFIKKIQNALRIQKVDYTNFLGLHSFQLYFPERVVLKVDFNYYPFPRIEKGTKYKNMEIDSMRDIAANKIHTLFMKPRARDYIDLYFLIKQQNFSLGGLIADAKAKFDWDIDKVNLANQLLRVRDFSEFPKMFVQFNRQDMEKFFTNLAKSLEKEIFKG